MTREELTQHLIGKKIIGVQWPDRWTCDGSPMGPRDLVIDALAFSDGSVLSVVGSCQSDVNEVWASFEEGDDAIDD